MLFQNYILTVSQQVSFGCVESCLFTVLSQTWLAWYLCKRAVIIAVLQRGAACCVHVLRFHWGKSHVENPALSLLAEWIITVLAPIYFSCVHGLLHVYLHLCHGYNILPTCCLLVCACRVDRNDHMPALSQGLKELLCFYLFPCDSAIASKQTNK